MRLIDADPLIGGLYLYKRHIELVRNVRATRRNRAEDAMLLDFVDMVKSAPAIDAVEVVRCKECKNGKYEFVDNKDWIYCKRHYDYWTADDHCSYGERRE